MRGKAWVQGFIGKLERCQTRCHGHWVTGQRTRLVDRTNRCEVIHDVCAAAKSRSGQATRDNLAEGHQVTGDMVHAEPTLVGGAETGHDLINNQQGTIVMRDIFQCLVEAFRGCYRAHVAGGSFSNNAGNLTWVISKSLLDRIQVVIRHNDGICRSRTGNTR